MVLTQTENQTNLPKNPLQNAQALGSQIWKTMLPPGLLLGTFRAKVNISIDRGDFLLKTASTPAEVIKAAKLRYLVFSRNVPGKKNLWQVELDEFDRLADHLIVIHKPSKKIIGTYRLLCSKVTQKFYSETEFDMSAIKSQKEIKVELGRACIHPDYRSSLMIPLLWRGIIQYAKNWNASFLFGCSSVFMDQFDGLPELNRLLLDDFGTAPEFRTYPRRTPPLMSGQDSLAPAFTSEEQRQKVKSQIPSLLQSYLNAGARIAGLPSWDPEFGCIDYLTLFDLRQVDSKYQKKFQV